MVTSKAVREALEEQVQLLDKRSKERNLSPDELSRLSMAMAEISRVLST